MEASNTEIQSSFNRTLQDSNLLDFTTDMSELAIDQLIDEDVLREIPIVKSIVSLTKVGISIHDKLFLKKIITFMYGIKDIAPEKRLQMIRKIDSSKQYSIKVGEKLLYVLDTCGDHVIASNIAKLFAAFLSGKITYNQYLEAAPIVARLSENDLKIFLGAYAISYMRDASKELTHTGLVYFDIEQVSVDVEKREKEDWDDPKERYEASVSGGEATILPTSAGDTIFEIIGIGKEARAQEIKRDLENLKQKRKEAISI